MTNQKYKEKRDAFMEHGQPKEELLLRAKSPVCPNCGWTSRVEYLRRTKTFKCTHCGAEWKKEG